MKTKQKLFEVNGGQNTLTISMDDSSFVVIQFWYKFDGAEHFYTHSVDVEDLLLCELFVKNFTQDDAEEFFKDKTNA